MRRLSSLLAGMAAIATLSFAADAAPMPQRLPQPGFSSTYLVFFEEGKASLAPEARDILRGAAQTARTMGNARVQVMVASGGHENIALAKDRAQSVRMELVRDGLAPRVIANANPPQDSSFADADPVVRAWLDRRAVIVVSPTPNAGADELVER